MQKPDGQAAFSTRNHLLVTANHLIRGTITPCTGRLSDLLRKTPLRFLCVKDALLVPLSEEPQETWGEIRVQRKTLLLAHEFLNLGADLHLQQMGQENAREVAVEVILTGFEGLSIQGHMVEHAEGADDLVLTLTAPHLVARDSRAALLARELGSLPYLLLDGAQVEILKKIDVGNGAPNPE